MSGLRRRNIRYYVDLALVPVVLVSLLVFLPAIWHWPPGAWSKQGTVLGASVLAVSLLLAQEPRVVFGAVLAYIAVQSGFGISVSPSLKHAAVFAAVGLVAAIALLGLIAQGKNHKLGYDSPSSRTDYVISAGVFACVAVGIILILRDTIHFYVR